MSNFACALPNVLSFLLMAHEKFDIETGHKRGLSNGQHLIVKC